MKIIVENGRPRYEDDAGNPLPFGINGFSIDYGQGEGLQAAISIDLHAVRAMMNPRVCIVMDSQLVPVESITLKDGRVLSSGDLMKALQG